jgi:hypothetical protein
VQAYLRLLGRKQELQDLGICQDEGKLAEAELAGGWVRLRKAREAGVG